MSLEVVDDKSRVKTKLRSTFLNKACDLYRTKGLDEDAAGEKARATELQLYRNSKDRNEYKEKALKVFVNLKRQERDGVPAEDSPTAKKRKVEDGGDAADADDAAAEPTGEADGAVTAPAAPIVLATTGDPMRDKVRQKVAAALRMVPERDREAINNVRAAMKKGALSEEEVAAAVEDEMHRVLTGESA
jgi:hypothetical protein